MKLFEVVLFLSFVGNIMGRECYVCGPGSSCSDPFTGSDSLKQTCSSEKYCFKEKIEFQGTSSVTRSCSDCARDGCVSVEAAGGSGVGCCCSTDYCNGAGSLGVMSTLATAVVGLVAMVIARY
ncbi:uncharacterized protein LOC110977084 [Acanthaster planci]|uniref:Uncharacterized protein LOC110977084 n=1 Tax=Acanthaster planci TaxID=133434 RepID=A0A8B7Y098_ACAPL|nr:uncharacterized protein LOC110977084 [Acanthaster planci]